MLTAKKKKSKSTFQVRICQPCCLPRKICKTENTTLISLYNAVIGTCCSSNLLGFSSWLAILETQVALKGPKMCHKEFNLMNGISLLHKCLHVHTPHKATHLPPPPHFFRYELLVSGKIGDIYIYIMQTKAILPSWWKYVIPISNYYPPHTIKKRCLQHRMRHEKHTESPSRLSLGWICMFPVPTMPAGREASLLNSSNLWLRSSSEVKASTATRS